MLKILLSFIVGIIVAYISFFNAERKISIENITKERAKWREKIRQLAGEVHVAITEKDEPKLEQLKCQFRLHLNPSDRNDTDILDLICLGEDKGANQTERFSICVSHLLKHDWERAKLESQPFYMRFQFLYPQEGATASSPSSVRHRFYQFFFHPPRVPCPDKTRTSENAN